MPSALIGSTGFVGGNLLRQARFDALYHSANIADIRGRSFDLVVCAGARAEKWKANQDPAADRAGIAKLTDALAEVRAGLVVLVSTVDVYPEPAGVEEATPIDPERASAYGRHRYELERWLAGRFDTLVVRLPGLFGSGLRKNVVYDLLHDNQVHKINPAAVYQYYDLQRLWADVQTCLGHGLRLVNFAAEPLPTAELLAEVFARRLPELPGPAARYDFRSRHAALFGGAGGYLYNRQQVIAALRRFVEGERGRLAA
jgi:nucleoside-diphosphate-sugar epimerase